MIENKELKIIQSLIEKFNSNDVLYCHFKSNEHVIDGIKGETDLDILITRSDHSKALGLLLEGGFKLFPSVPLAGYNAVEDWIGLDEDTGRLTHLHIHWQMIAGEPNLKGYRIPWENQILLDRKFDKNSEIYTSSPEMEMLLLLTRATFKATTRHYLKIFLGKSVLSVDLNREYVWLLERMDYIKFEKLTNSILPDDLSKMMIQAVKSKKLGFFEFHRLRRETLRYLKNWRTYNSVEARSLRWFRELWLKYWVRIFRFIGFSIVHRRTPATGGLVVAMVGCDGSGKSTQAKALYDLLSWKIDVIRVYFGSGSGPVSWHRKLIQQTHKLIPRNKNQNAKTHQVSTNSSNENNHQPNVLKRFYDAFYAISLALEKRNKIKKVIRTRNRGMIIICDRYPQNQFLGFNDGPLLGEWPESGRLWRLISNLEKRILNVFSETVPDLVIKLNVSEEVASLRKSDTPKEMIRKKIDAVRDLNFGTECKVIGINADKPLKEVELLSKKAVWEML